VWQAHWLVELGTVQRAAGQSADALVSYQRAAAIQRQLGDRSREAFALDGAGQAYEDMGRVEDAADFYRTAAAAHRDLNDRWNLAQTLHHLGRAAGDTGSWQEARDLLADFGDPRAAALRRLLTETLLDQ
jgi:tetratricopeptide (TPR) repeat protein